MTETKPNGMQMLPRPLEGIRIVECATWHAAPGGSAILADLGADVIKIETFAGDPERHQKNLGAVQFELEGKPGWTFLYEMSNRNKRGICLDIKSEKGRQIVHQLVKEADVFVTNLRKTTKPKYGMDYETLSAINPKLVHANMSGFGPEGPMGNAGGFDPLGQAISGMMYLADDKEPVYLQAVILDQMASIAFSHAVMAALLARERQGIGQEIHVSLYSAALMLMHTNALATGMMKKNPVSSWDRTRNPPLRNNFKCKDDRWLIGTNHPEQKYWPTFCRVTGLPSLENDPRFADSALRINNAPELVKILDAVFLTKTCSEWMQIFLDAGLLFAPIQSLSEVIEDPQALANSYIVDFDHPQFGSVQIPGYPASFSGSSAGTYRAAPDLGEHTDQVMQELGMPEDEILALRESGVLK